MCVKLKIKMISYYMSVFILSVSLLVSGCSLLNGNGHDTYSVSQEKLQQIDTLELFDADYPEAEKKSGEEKDEKKPAEFQLSLEECRALTLENNLDLKAQLINPAIETERVNEQEARFEALFTIDAVYSNTERVPASFWDLVLGTKRETVNIESGVKVPLRSGGTVNFNLTDNKEETNAPPIYVKNNPTYSSDLSFSISQPLLRNAGKRAATYYIQVYEYNRQIVSARTKQTATNIIAMADQAYWNLYAARRLLDVRRQEYNLAKDLLAETELLVEVGSRAEIDTIRAQAGVASRLERIIDAENTVRNMERNFKLMLNKPGLGIIMDTSLIPTTSPDPVHYEFDIEKMVTKAIDNRMDMLDMELRLAMDDSAIEYNRNQLHPVLNFYYAYNISGIGGSRNDSYDMLFDNEYAGHMVNLYASVPLGNKAAKSGLNKAVLTRTKQLSSIENKKAMIKKEVLKGIDQVEASWQSILARRETTLHMEKQYKAEKRQYELGMVTATDVLEAQKDLADAQRMEVYALAQYQIDLIDLAYSTGTLLGAARVELETMVPEKR